VKKLLLILTLICMIALPVYGQTGTYTTHNLFYLPEYGAYGLTEYNEYNAYMEIADLQIWANKTDIAGIDLSLYYLKTEINTQAKIETIWGVNLANDSELHTQNTDTDLDATFEATFFKKADSIGDIGDVDLTDIANLKILKYNSTSGNWECEDESGGGSTTFTGLTDTPANYTGQAGLYAKVNAGETALEFGTPTGGVDTSGTPEANDIARFIDVDTIEGINYTELKTALALDSDDLSDVASIAMLDEAEMVLGQWTFTSFNIYRASDTPSVAPTLSFQRKRDGDPTSSISSGDYLGKTQFYGYVGTSYELGAEIRAIADGTTGAYDIPVRLEFLTSPDGDCSPILRMAIDNAGNIKIGDGAWTNYVNVTAGGAMTFEGTASINAPLSKMAATTSAELAGVISDETGTLKLVYSDSPVFTTQITTPIIALTGGQVAFPATANPSAGANTLDDYEEGTWTMGISFGGGTTGITYSINTGYYTKIGNLITISGKLELTSKGTSTGQALVTGLPFTTTDADAGLTGVPAIFFNITFANQLVMTTARNTNHIDIYQVTEAGAITALSNTNFANNSTIVVGGTYRCQ